VSASRRASVSELSLCVRTAALLALYYTWSVCIYILVYTYIYACVFLIRIYIYYIYLLHIVYWVCASCRASESASYIIIMCQNGRFILASYFIMECVCLYTMIHRLCVCEPLSIGVCCAIYHYESEHPFYIL